MSILVVGLKRRGSQLYKKLAGDYNRSNDS